MRWVVCLLSALLLTAVPLVPIGSAHKFNHEDQHEKCEVYGSPNSHFVGDGHVHTHDPAEAATKNLHDHDPCKQIRMSYPAYENKAPLSEISPPTAEITDPAKLLFSDGNPNNVEVYVGGEAYQFPIPESSIKRQDNLVVLSDLQAAGMGFPGDGSPANPYIVEGYLITGNMVFKDTSKCFVFRNNAVVSRIVKAPLIPDPDKIIDLGVLTPFYEELKRTAEELRAEYLNLSAYWDSLKAVWDGNKAVWDQNKATLDDELADFQAQAQAWQDAFDSFEQRYIDMVVETQFLADDFEWYANQYVDIAQPPRGHSSFVDIPGRNVLDMDALQDAFEAYQQDLDDDLTGEDVEGWILSNPPPETRPADFWGNDDDWAMERQNYQVYADYIVMLIGEYWNDLMASAPDQAAYEQFLADFAAFQTEYDAFMVDYNAFIADFSAFMVDYNAFQDEFDQVWAQTGSDIAKANAHFAKVANWAFEYVGQLGTKLFNTLDQLLDWVLNLLFGIIDGLINPNIVVANTGQMVLDWNGQCIHAYNNVVNDLRVNQNNDRTGWATGGILEDNRFFTIGQIRHYDGIFRQNEVGNRAHLIQLLNPSIVPLAASARSINNDGANQGWYFDNVIYGNVDLDFHGHHHSAGFFSPLSHYHGSTLSLVEMYTAGVCTAKWSNVDMSKHNGPHKDYPQDSSIEVLGTPITPGQDESGQCLDHMDHSKRWTSVFFNDNVIIDPNGVGLRFEDRDHRADDEKANSENVQHLKAPHFHQKWVELEGNVVVGKIFVDILNAAGTNLWSDNWAPAIASSGPARTVEALAHPGAEIVNSHPYRNDAWLDIQQNTVFQTQTSGILVSDAEDLTLFQLKENRGFALPAGIQTGKTRQQMISWLKGTEARTPDAVQGDITSWGGTDRGVQTFVSLANLRDAFNVQHCMNTARGLDRGLVATDRIFDDGQSIVQACGTNDWGSANPAVDIRYTPAPVAPARCTEDLREQTDDTDDFYVSELAFDTVDVVPASTCESLPV